MFGTKRLESASFGIGDDHQQIPFFFFFLSKAIILECVVLYNDSNY